MKVRSLFAMCALLAMTSIGAAYAQNTAGDAPAGRASVSVPAEHGAKKAHAKKKHARKHSRKHAKKAHASANKG